MHPPALPSMTKIMFLQERIVMGQSISSFMLLLKQKYRVALVAMLLAMVLVFSGFSPMPTAHAAATHSITTSSQKVAMAAASTTVHGCPLYYACIYPQNAGWNGDHPSLMFYYYGA